METFFDLVFSSSSSRELKNLVVSKEDADSDTEAGESICSIDAMELLAALVQSSSSIDSNQYKG